MSDTLVETPLPVIQRMTTEFSEHQDRLKLLCAVQNEQVITIWMTQRLLRRVLPVLLEWVEKQLNITDATQAELLHSFAQAKAESAMAENTPVVPNRPTPLSGESAFVEAGLIASRDDNWLANTITIKFISNEIVLHFSESDTPHKAALSMPAAALRQWLSALYKLCKKCEWPLTWPNWLETPTSPDAVPKQLH